MSEPSKESESASNVNCEIDQKLRIQDVIKEFDDNYDFELVNECDDEFKCAICCDVLEDPKMHRQCGNVICGKHLTKVDKCPFCRVPFNDIDIIPETVNFKSLINKMAVKCNYCKQEMSLEQFRTIHKNMCEVACPFCGTKVAKKELMNHYEESCPKHTISCKGFKLGCNWKGSGNDYQIHRESCVFAKLMPYIDGLTAKIDSLQKQLNELQSNGIPQKQINEIHHNTTVSEPALHKDDEYSFDDKKSILYIYSMPNYTFNSKYPWSHLKDRVSTIVMTDGITSISPGAFQNFSNLTEARISNTVTTIGLGAFYNCKKLPNIIIPPSLTFIDKNAFQNCVALKSICIPTSCRCADTKFYFGPSVIRN